MNVREVMTSPVVAVRPETPLKEVARLLVERRISGVPVVDESERVVGVVSEGDFLRKEAGGGTEHRTLWMRLRGRHPDQDVAVSTTAGELMTKPPVTAEADLTLHAAAALMARRQVNRLPVVEDGRLVGIVTRADIVRAFVRTDEDLARAVWETIHAVDGLRVEEVREGVVVLAGTVADPAIEESVRRTVLEIDGVVALDDRNVAWPRPPEEHESDRWKARHDYRSI